MDFQIPDDWRYMRVKEELDRGRLWKARDRLHGRLVEEPANQDVLGLLGDIYFAMGDLPQAGRYWFLTERDDERAHRAFEAFTERFGRANVEMLANLPRIAPPDRYPDAVRARLGMFDPDNLQSRIVWVSGRSLTDDANVALDAYAHQDDGWTREGAALALGLLGVLALAAIGAVAVVIQIVQLLT